MMSYMAYSGPDYQRLKSTGKLLDVHIVVRQTSIAIGGELYGKRRTQIIKANKWRYSA